MRRQVIALSFASALSMLAYVTDANAQIAGRGTSGYGNTGTSGGNGTGVNGGRTTPSFTGSANSNQNAGQDPNSDYNQIMNSVNADTQQAYGPPKSDDDADQDADAKSTATQAGNPYTAHPTLGANGNMAAQQPSLTTLPNAAGGYGNTLATPYNGNNAYGPTTTGNGPYTTATGTTGLGEYNNSPYSRGVGAVAPSNNSPTAPTVNSNQ